MTLLNVSERTQRAYDRLPEHYRDADAAQLVPAALPALTAATNLSTRPRTPGILPNGPTWTVTTNTAIPAGHPHGHTTGTMARLADGASDPQFASLYNLDDLIDTATVRYLGVWVIANVPCNVDLYIVGAPEASFRRVTFPANVWTWVNTAAPGPGHTVLAASAIGRPAAATDRIWLGGTLASSTPAVSYFDGSTVADLRYGPSPYAWTGTPLLSTSTRAARSAEPAGLPLLRYLRLLLDQLEPVDELLERITYDLDAGDTTSDLVDAQTANASWFPWLGQLLGIDLEGLTIDQQRYVLRFPRWDHGSPSAIAQAAQRGLTGTKVVNIVSHYDGNPWAIGIGTKDSQTATPDTWAKLEAWAPTWGQLEALGSFAGAAAPTVLAAAEVERPAGYRFVRYSTGA